MSDYLWKNRYICCDGKEKVRIAIMYQVASYWPTIESFYEACVEAADVEVRIFFVDRVSVESAQVTGSDEFLRAKNIPFSIYSEEAIREFLPHAAIYQPPYDVSYRNPDALSIHLMGMGIRIVYIPYGIEIADTQDARFNHFHTFVVRNAWRIYTFSELMRSDYLQYCPNYAAVRALGVPKFDALANRKSESADNMREKAGARKIVLWKLHFPKLIYEGDIKRQVTPYLEEYRKFAEMLDSYKELFFVVMPHPMFFSHTIDKELAAEAQELLDVLQRKENVLIDRKPDYRESLYSADAIIVDRSAVMVEAGFLDVPVLYMENEDYKEPLTIAVKKLVDVYEHGTSCRDMQEFVARFCETGLPDVVCRMKDARQSLISFQLGMCGRNILEDIKAGVRASESPVVRIAFFGAGFICEHYIEELGINRNASFEIVCLSDNDSKKWNTQRGGISVVSPERLKELNPDIIVITSEQYYMPIKKKLVYDLCMDEDKIRRLDQFAEAYRKDVEAE